MTSALRTAVAAVLLSTPATLSAQAAMTLYHVDPSASTLVVVTHRAGLLAFLGHEHAIVPGSWEARLCLARPIADGSWGSIAIDSPSLVVDSDSARALAGLGGGPGPDDRREIQAKMLDAGHLDAASFAEIRLDVQVVDAGSPERPVVDGPLTLHGVTREERFPVGMEAAEDGTLTLSGSLRIRQRDFGIEPESRVGVVKVSNDVDLRFALTAHPTDAPCAAGAP
jgi:YceI-like domain